MNKFTKLILTSAVFATSGFATTNTIEGILEQSENLNIYENTAITATGRLAMKSGAIIMSSGKSISNTGTIDISVIPDFSQYKGTVTGESGSSVVIPGPKVTIASDKKAADNAFTCDGTYNLTYDSGASVSLEKNDKKLQTKLINGSTYANADAAKTALGISFDGTPTLNPIGSTKMTMAEVVSNPLNAAEDNDTTFDMGDSNLASGDLNLTTDKDIYFGIVGDSTKNLNITGGNVTLKGDCSGMLGKLSSDSDVTFENKAAVGKMEIVGKLTYSKTGEDPLEISTAQEIKAGKFSLSKGVTLKSSAPISIGWTFPNLRYFCNVTFASELYKRSVYKNPSDYISIDFYNSSNKNWFDISFLSEFNENSGSYSKERGGEMNESTLNSIGVTINETTINYSGLVQKMNNNTIINTEYTWSGGLSYSELYGILSGIENGTYTYVGEYYIGG